MPPQRWTGHSNNKGLPAYGLLMVINHQQPLTNGFLNPSIVSHLNGGLNQDSNEQRQRASHEDRRFSPGSKDDQEGEKDQRGKKRKRKKGRKKNGHGWKLVHYSKQKREYSH